MLSCLLSPVNPFFLNLSIHNTQAEADNNPSLVLVTLCEFWWHANDFPTQLYKLQIHNVCIPHNSQCHPQMACCIHGPTIRSDCIHSTTFICANPRGGYACACQHLRDFATLSEVWMDLQKYAYPPSPPVLRWKIRHSVCQTVVSHVNIITIRASSEGVRVYCKFMLYALVFWRLMSISCQIKHVKSPATRHITYSNYLIAVIRDSVFSIGSNCSCTTFSKLQLSG